MPRAALLSLHARVEGIAADALGDPALAQLWGPRYATYVVAKEDFALFSLGRLPDEERGRTRAEEMATRIRSFLGRRRLDFNELCRGTGTGNALRYATTTGTVAIRWDGARAPVVWTVPRPKLSPAAARRELARRYLHIFGPSTGARFARWAGIALRAGEQAFSELDDLVPVRTPLGEERLLAADEEALRAAPADPAAARLLPSGDAYTLLDGAERALLVPRAGDRARLWTPRVWPGALLVEGEIRGTWRRAQHLLTVEPWGRLTSAQRRAVEAEAASLPLPGVERAADVVWG